MAVSAGIEKYIENSKINGKLCKWQSSQVSIFVTPIVANNPNKAFLYSEVQRAINVWNTNFRKNSINLQLNIVPSPVGADIVVHWVKVGRVFEGMCKYVSVINGFLKKISIEIGLENEFSGKNTTTESIFSAILHELGHAIGLGHGIDFDDIMYVPHQKNVQLPSENDIYVLKEIYK